MFGKKERVIVAFSFAARQFPFFQGPRLLPFFNSPLVFVNKHHVPINGASKMPTLENLNGKVHLNSTIHTIRVTVSVYCLSFSPSATPDRRLPTTGS